MIVIVLNKFFTNSSCDAAEPWQLGFQDAATPMMQGIIDLHHDIFFFLILILVFVSRILVRALWHFNYQKNPIPQRIVHGTENLGVLFSVVAILIIMFFPIMGMAFCDAIGSLERPPTPPTVELPGAAVQAPEVHPQPAPPIVPELEHPLLSDDVRSDILYSRYGIQNFGGDAGFRRLSSIISNQVMVERSVEAALVDDGFHPLSIHHRYRDIRQLIHSPRGELLSERTYRAYVSQIQEQGTRESVPYRRVIQAVRSSHLLLDRADGRWV